MSFSDGSGVVMFERIEVDSRESHAVAVWKAATDEGVNRSDSVHEWLRR